MPLILHRHCERLDALAALGLRQSRKLFIEHNDDDSEGLVTGIITEFEKHAWFLRASLES